MQLSDAVILQASGFDGRWGRVLASVDLGDLCFALIDSNGNGDGGLEACQLVKSGNGEWTDGGSISGDGAGHLSGIAFVCGPGTPGSQLTVEYAGRLSVVVVNPNGWWAFASRRQPAFDALPALVQ